MAVPEPIHINPINTKIHFSNRLSGSRSRPITKSATVPIQKISTNVAIPGLCFSGIHRSVTKTPEAIIALPKERVVLSEIPSWNTPQGPSPNCEEKFNGFI